MSCGKTVLVSVSVITTAFIIYNAIQRNRKSIPVFYRKNLHKNYNARTIPPFGIFIKESEKDNSALLEHEKVHWEQYRTNGLLPFYSRYISEMKKHGYDKMPMEKEARKNESEHCRENYSECVRNGFASTVHNPQFRI